MEDFDVKLHECQVKNHFEFHSLRRTKSCTIALLHELSVHEGYICNSCEQDIKMSYFYHCPLCDDFDLCIKCYFHEAHPHKMEQFGINLCEAAEDVFRDYLKSTHYSNTDSEQYGKEGIVKKLRQLAESKALKDFDSKLHDCQVKNHTYRTYTLYKCSKICDCHL